MPKHKPSQPAYPHEIDGVGVIRSAAAPADESTPTRSVGVPAGEHPNRSVGVPADEHPNRSVGVPADETQEG